MARAMSFIADAKQVAPDKPFFLNLCLGATHAPHHVPQEWADRYRGRFDDGWDAYREQTFARQKQLGVVPSDAQLSPRDPDVPAWESLSAEARRLAARLMEVYAGFLSHSDHHLGRLLAFLKETGEFDNTLIMVVSDNGASAEGGVTGTTNEMQFFNNAPETLEESLARIDELGGPTTFNHYPWGWTWAGNTPFRRWKRETYRGGVSDPFLVHWPDGIRARGEVRDQFAHIIDMVPTVLDVLGIEAPATIRGVTQSPLHGVSFAHTFDDADAASRHRTQYYEMLGHRAIDHDGWRAVCPWPGPSFEEAERPFGTPITMADLDDLDAHHWELYHVDEDIAETKNLAQEHRSKLIEMIALWYVEAGKYNVMPIDGSVLQRIMTERPQITENRTSYTFRSGTQTVPAAVAPRLLNRPHSVTADVEIPPGGAQGVLLCQGTNMRRLVPLRQGRPPALRPQLRPAGPVPRGLRREPARGAARAAFRVRAHRRPGHHPRQGRTRARPALHRRPPRRTERHAGHHPDRHQPGRHGLRRQPRVCRHLRLPGAIPLHRHPPQRHRRPVRRPHRRRRERDAHAHGPPVSRPPRWRPVAERG